MTKIIQFGDQKKKSSRFEQLIKPHADHLYRIAFRFCGSKADAEDLVQDLFIKLYTCRADLEEVDQLRPWLVKSLYRLFVDQYRRDARSPIRLVNDEPETFESAAPQTAQPEYQVTLSQTQHAIQAALERLPDDHRALVVLCDIEGYSIPEAQQVLDIPGGTVKSRLHRARARLRELLKKQN